MRDTFVCDECGNPFPVRQMKEICKISSEATPRSAFRRSAHHAYACCYCVSGPAGGTHRMDRLRVAATAAGAANRRRALYAESAMSPPASAAFLLDPAEVSKLLEDSPHLRAHLPS